MATTATTSSPNGLSPPHTTHTHGSTNNNNYINGGNSSSNSNGSNTSTPTTTNIVSPLPQQTQQATPNLQRQLSQSQSQQLPNLESTPRSSHSDTTPPSLHSIPQHQHQSQQSNKSNTTNNACSSPHNLHIQPHQSQSVPLLYNQYTPNNSTTTTTAKNGHFLSPKSPYHSSSSVIKNNGYITGNSNSSTLSTPRSGSISGPSTPSFKFNSPSPTTPTFATSFPSTVSQQSVASLNPQDYDFIFDVRPFNLYSKSRITKSTNLCLPTTLLKRNSMSLIDLINMVDLSSDLKEVFTKHLQKEGQQQQQEEVEDDKLSILIYDQCSSNDAITFPLYQTISKFEKYHDRFNIYYLDGGFSGALIQNNGVVETMPLMNNSRDGNDGGANSNGHRKTKSLSGFTLPSATNFKTKFVQSIKKNNDYDVKKGSDTNKEFFSDLPNEFAKPSSNTSVSESTDSSYKYKLREIPAKLTLPHWLQFMKQDSNDESLKYMIAKFNKIEEIEKCRLNKMASNFKSPYTANIQGQDKIFSPCCPDCSKIDFQLPQGIEFGYKNRFNNVWPYEHSRVKLGQAKNDVSAKEEEAEEAEEAEQNHSHVHQHNHSNHKYSQQDDYFNGNYINTNALISNSITYIATQNPLASTIDDFWSTIEQEDVQIIVNLETKPIQYFDHPKVKSIEMIDTPYPDFKLRLINNHIYHFHYLSWPDFGIPQSFKSILDMVQYKNQLIEDHKLNKKLLVHCTAGCGRTGVFITIDALIQAWKNSKQRVMDSDIDLVYKLVQHQRRQRVGMVQNLDQFIIIYEIFIEYLINNK
ncbi:hypothetical protein CANMA_003349 [Candida margitis]|uniref:uncharacterized protein n=1 Tax=Candida margitis TaxID=1775924 RepID=UPI0022273A80|nr:uncharacterized protein CANMA_003349 [Candida margitis]KAI5966103.1 hypothetical protein CANMA_003349 [Candida margitis]